MGEAIAALRIHFLEPLEFLRVRRENRLVCRRGSLQVRPENRRGCLGSLGSLGSRLECPEILRDHPESPQVRLGILPDRRDQSFFRLRNQ